MTERALTIDGGRLVAILSEPAAASERPAVVLLSSGVLHRAGPSRLYVALARDLAEAGFAVLRLDLSSIGDSAARTDDLAYIDSAVVEARAAMDALTAATGARRFVVGGICSAGTEGYLTAVADERVVGALMINARGWLEGQDQALRIRRIERSMTRHYLRMAMSPTYALGNWRKLFTGRVNYGEAFGALARAPVRLLHRLFARGPRHDDSARDGSAAELAALAARGARLLLVHSEGDEGLDYLRFAFGAELDGWVARGLIRYELIRGANHIFTLVWSQRALRSLVRDWMVATYGDG